MSESIIDERARCRTGVCRHCGGRIFMYGLTGVPWMHSDTGFMQCVARTGDGPYALPLPPGVMWIGDERE